MLLREQIVLISFILFSIFGFFLGLYKSYKHKAAFEINHYFLPLGVFAYGDFVIFGPFWIIVSLFALITQSWIFFCFIYSIFWVVRSVGETIYWFNQQFSTIVHYKANAFWPYKIFQNDSVWFIYQIIMQCITVVSIIASLYFGKFWLATV